jgi:predicted nucleotidyltransferase
MSDFGLQTHQIEGINNVFSQYSQIEQVILYGSRAKGTFKPGSDIDLTIIDKDLSFSDFLQIQTKLDDLLLPFKIDLSQKRKLSNAALLEHIERFGVEFFHPVSIRNT